jgi:hypothetical protein
MIELRRTTEADVPGTIAMLHEHWSVQGWGSGKYNHYYRDYPEGETISAIAVEDQKPVAHFGVLPIRVSGIEAGLILQVLVRSDHRRGRTLHDLVRFSENAARESGMRFLCGFANARFAKVAQRMLGWKILGYLRFADVDAIDLTPMRDRYRFEYGDAWYDWKLGRQANVYVHEYAKEDTVHHQLLKTRGFPRLSAKELGVPQLNLWHPDRYTASETSEWSQPIVYVPLDPTLPPDLADISRWYIEMGDSDTFEPHRPWSDR